VRKELSTAFRIPESDIRIIVVEPGGAYGGKQRGEVELEAAWLAREVGAPVKLSWTREEEFTASYCRPAGIVDVAAGLDEKGKVHAYWHRNYNSGAAGLKPPYAIPHYSCEFHRSEAPVRQGSYRSLASAANNFARESMMNELAAITGSDPLEYRLRNLEDSRLKHVLERAGERFGWGKRKGGLACTIEKDARLALFVEMDGTRARRAVMAIDPGGILNPDGLRSQCEGGIVQGLGGALFEELTYDTTRITNAKLAQYRVPRFSDAPEIDILLVDRRDIESAGAGEAPITLVAPAVAAALGGTRRTLPLLRADKKPSAAD
jgi:isoquinoline 1-oxidoreductase